MATLSCPNDPQWLVKARGGLWRNDSELAEVVEGFSTVLLARAEAQDEARAMIGFVEAQLLSPDLPLGS